MLLGCCYCCFEKGQNENCLNARNDEVSFGNMQNLAFSFYSAGIQKFRTFFICLECEESQFIMHV